MGDGDRAFGYVGALDGLRALAVLAVLLFHADLGVAGGGFLGVSVFFTLSGFLITSLLLHEHDSTGRVDLRGFYERRVRRLMPAAHLCVASVLAAGVWWGAAQRRSLPGDAIAAVANVANWRFALTGQSYQDLFLGMPSPLAHFWSLAIEEQCYLLLPVVAAWAMRRGGSRPLGVVLSAMLAGSLVATLLTSDTDLVYNATHTRAGELLIGAVAAVLVVHVRPGRRTAAAASVLGLAVLGLLVVAATLRQGWLYRGGFLLVAVVSATTVVGLTVPQGVSRMLGSRPFTAVGRRSYGVYLYHWPLFLLLTPERVGVDGWRLFAVRLAATAAVTVCSYSLLEQPVRARRLLRGRRVLAGAVSIAAVAVAVVAVPPPQFTRTEQLLAMGDNGPITFTRAGVEAAAPPRAFAMAPGRGGPPKVLLLGSDSTPAVALRDAGFEVADGTVAGCPVSGGAEVRLQDGSVVDVSGCAAVLDHWTHLLHDTSPDVVVLAVGDIDAGLTRMPTDLGFPAADDVPGTARLLAAAEQSMRRVVAALDTSELPVLFHDSVVLGGERPINRLALGSSPPRQVHHSTVALVAAVQRATGGSDAADHRVLVVGDSTSLDMAQAISDAGQGRVAVQWAGANGCPFVRTEATRSASSVEWQEGRCPDYASTVPGLVAQFRPDAVVVVLGPTELQQHRYPGDANPHVSGDPAFVTAHDAAMASFLGAVGDAPVLVTDGPAIQPGVWATREMADPQRVGSWNLQVARWDQASPQVVALPYAAALASYEWEHGPIRADGVHPDVEHLTELVGEWLMPFIDAIAGEWDAGGLGGASTAEPTGDAADNRLLVIGDSTSLMAARALADGSDGALVVRWAGQEGCPLVRATAARPARDAPWRALTCADPASALPAVVDEFAPDAVLVVLGAMELMELRGVDGTTMLPGDAAYRAAHDEVLNSLLSVLHDRGVQLLFADSPPLGVGSFSTFEMADPGRADAFNRMVGDWDRHHGDVSVLAYGGPISRFEAEHGSIRPDGSHPSIEPLTNIARAELVPSLLALLRHGI